MDSRNKLQSEEDLSSDRKYQTSSNNMTNTIQNIFNNHCKSITVYKNNKNNNKISNIPKINIQKAKETNFINTKFKPNNMESQTGMNQKMGKPASVPKTSPYTFKYFCFIANKKRPLNNSTLGINSIKENNDMESNFINLSKDANIYTSNAEYIQNKKMLLFDKTNYDDKKYKPDRANIFNMTNIPQKISKTSTLYKTTMFRGGKLYFKKKEETNKKLDYFNKEKFKKNVKNKFFENMPIDNMIEFIEQNKEKLFPKITKKNIIIGDDSQEKAPNIIPYNSLYKKIMSKKEEIFDNIINNKINENNKIIISHNPHQRNFPSFNNSSTMNPQNNSMETNILNNSSSKINNSSYKFNNRSNRYNNSSSNLTNFSGFTNLLLKKNNDGIPIIFPVVSSTFAKCNSVSQSSRYQNIMDNFIKVKTYIENDKNN